MYIRGGKIALLVGLLVGTVGAARAQITTHTALPITEGRGVVRMMTRFVQASGSLGKSDRDLTAWAFPVVGVYGATEKLALFGIVPFVTKSLEVRSPQGSLTRSATGLADAHLFGRYTIFVRNRPGLTLRLALFGGLEMPTGPNEIADRRGRLPPALQPGSGSWDPFAGVTLTRQTFTWQMDLNLSYQHNGEASGFQFGDELRFDPAFKYRLVPRDLGGGVPRFCYVNLESNLIWQDENQQDGAEMAATGGWTWLLDPGLQLVTRRVVIEGAVQLPVYQDVGAAVLERGPTFILSTRVNI